MPFRGYLEELESLEIRYGMAHRLRNVVANVCVRFCSVGPEKHTQVLKPCQGEPRDAQCNVVLRTGALGPLFKSIYLRLRRSISDDAEHEVNDCLEDSCPILVIIVERVAHEIRGGWILIDKNP